MMLNFRATFPIGIDIGSQHIYAVQLKQARQGFAVRALAHLELDAETDPVSDMDQNLVAAVKKLSKNRHFSGKSAVLHIPVNNISVFPLKFRLGETDSVEEVIVRESEKYLSFPLEDAVIDYPSLTSGIDGDRNNCKATVIAVRREHIEHYLHLMKQANLTVEAVDYRISSLIRLHRHFNTISPNPVILCNIGYNESLLTIVNQDNIIAQRVIPWGVRLLSEKILANLELSNAKENARFLLKTHGLGYENFKNLENDPVGLPDNISLDMRRALHQVITPSMDELLYEFHKMISYVRSEQQHPVFEGIYMYGHAALIHHLDRFLEKRLSIPARSVNPLAEVPLSDNVRLPDVSEGAPYSLALGLAMRKVTWL